MSALGRGIVEGIGGAMGAAETRISSEALLDYKAQLEERSIKLKAALEEQRAAKNRQTQIDVANIYAGRNTGSGSGVTAAERKPAIHEWSATILEGIGKQVSDAITDSSQNDIQTATVLYLEKQVKLGTPGAKEALAKYRQGVSQIEGAKDPLTFGKVLGGLGLLGSGTEGGLLSPEAPPTEAVAPEGAGMLVPSPAEGGPPAPVGPPAPPGPAPIESGLRNAGPQGQQKPPITDFLRQ
jgi:hypothetical protein